MRSFRSGQPLLVRARTMTMLISGPLVLAPAFAQKATQIQEFKTPRIVCYAAPNAPNPRRIDKSEVPLPVIIAQEDYRGFYLLPAQVGTDPCWVRSGQVRTDLNDRAESGEVCPKVNVAQGQTAGTRGIGERCR